MNRIIACYAVFFLSIPLLNGSAFGKGLNIEEIAQAIATQFNKDSWSLLDEMNVSAKAIATGKNVRFEWVLRVKKGVSSQKLNEFSNETRSEVLPQACKKNASSPAFSQGLYYTFSYSNTYGEKLAEFIVNQEECQKSH